MKVSNTSARLKQIMQERGLRQADILVRCEPYCKQYGVKIGRNGLSQYISGKYIPGQKILTVLALALGISETWLMGYDVSMNGEAKQEWPEGITPIDTRRYPMLGEIACGQPIFASEERESYVEAGTAIKADFCLTCKGDSMTGARIYDGDIVFVRRQEIVDNGEIAAVIIDDAVTLKRVFYYPEKGKLVLQAENPKYEPLVYVGDELNEIRILGKAVAFQSDVR